MKILQINGNRIVVSSTQLLLRVETNRCLFLDTVYHDETKTVRRFDEVGIETKNNALTLLFEFTGCYYDADGLNCNELSEPPMDEDTKRLFERVLREADELTHNRVNVYDKRRRLWYVLDFANLSLVLLFSPSQGLPQEYLILFRHNL